MREGVAENRRGTLLKRPSDRQPQPSVVPAVKSGWGRSQSNTQIPSRPDPPAEPAPKSIKARQAALYDPYRFAFGTIWVFTFSLYMRPNDLVPAIGTFPVAKIIAIVALVAYINAQMQVNKPILNRTIEAKMVYLMVVLSVLFIPFAASAMDSINLLKETYIKIVIIFVMMISVINTRERLNSLLKLIVICGTILAVFAIKSYLVGDFSARGVRIEGLVKGIFENPNDLATALCMLLPLSVSLGLNSRGSRRTFYFVCAVIMAVGIFATFSRGGFLGVFAVCLFLAWKFGGKRRVTNLIAAGVVLIVVLMVLPGGYRNRVVTIFNSDQDETGSAQARTELMHRAVEVAVRHPLIGVGLGNFHIYSVKEHVAHNGYLETAAELGVLGLIAYMTIIIAPFRRLLRVEKQMGTPTTESARQLRYLNIGLQAQLVAYIVTSFFLSIQYQWYLYYAAAFSIAMHQIYQAEESKDHVTHSPTPTANNHSGGPVRPPTEHQRPTGTLWPSYR